jgi:DNA-directed RNA polymerase specialized sigma subunit
MSSSTSEKVRALAENGVSQTDIADLVGVSRQRVHQILKEIGLKAKPKGVNQKIRDYVSENQLFTIESIMAATGAKRHAALAICRKMGKKPVECEKPMPKRAREVLDLASCGKTIKEISEILGIHQSHVSEIKSKYGIRFIADGRTKEYRANR